MRKFLTLIIFALIATVGYAQNNMRVVRGMVYNAEGTVIVGATVKAIGEDVTVVSGQGGVFEMRVSPYCQYIEASYEGMFSAQGEIDGSLIIFRLKTNKKYWEEKAKAEERARIAAEKEAAAKVKAEEDARIAAQKQAEAEKQAAEQVRIAAAKEAEAQRKAEAQARIVAEKEAAAKVKAEAQARIAAEKEAAAKFKAEEDARVAAQKQAEAEKSRKLYAEKQSGFASIVDLSYMVGMNDVHSSVGINYIAGYQISNLLYVGAGAGASLNLGAGASVRSIADPYMGSEFLNPTLITVPVFAYFRANFLNRRCSPFFALAAGGNFSGRQTLQLDLCDVMYKNMGIFVNPQLGVNFRTTTKTALYFAVGFKCLTTPACIEYTGYNATFKPSLGYGVDLHLGFTF